MTTARTFCRICEAACGLVAETDAAGRVTSLAPDRSHPVSRGFVCAKGTRFHEVASHPERLVRARLRDASGTREASVGEGIREAGARIRAIREVHGPHAVGLYFGNPLAFNTLGLVSTLAFARALGTRNLYSAASQDCANKFAGSQLVHGSALVHPIPDLERAELVVMLGSNPAVSQSSFVHLEGGGLALDRARRRGADLVFVDPRRTESAKRWGRHLAIRPGTDVFLLLALLHELRDVTPPAVPVTGLDRLRRVAAEVPASRAATLTGIALDDIVALARDIRDKRTVLHMSVGVNQGPVGTLSYVVLQAIAFVSGNLDREGGGLFHPWAVRAARLSSMLGAEASRASSRIGGFPSVLHALPGAVLADEILTPGAEKIRALVVVSGDPLVSIPGGERLRDAFSSLDLLLTIDLFESHTGRLAHVQLPAASWLERGDVANTTLFFQTTGLGQTAGPVTRAPGEAREEWRHFAALSAEVFGARWLGALAEAPSFPLPRPRFGFSMAKPRAGTYLGKGPAPPGRALRFFGPSIEDDVARLPGLAAEAVRGDLVMIGRRRRLGHNAWLHGGVHDGDAEPRAWMHADDLAERGLAPGARVRVVSDGGALELDVDAKEGVARGTVVVPHGLPKAGANANAVIPAGAEAVERASGQVRMTGIPVRVSGV